VPDVAFSAANSAEILTTQLNGFLLQANWNSIGYALAAAVGVKFAMPKSRLFVVTGDGAFQETCQAVSSYAWFEQNTVVFVIVNDIYGVVQAIGNPKPFRDFKPAKGPGKETKYPEPFNNVFAYNEIHRWNYHRMADLCGENKKGEKFVHGRTVTNTAELAVVLAEIAKNETHAFVVSVRVPKCDYPKGILPIIEAVGEDEIYNKNWPPKPVF